LAAKGWWIGCGTLAVVGVLILVLAVGYFATRAKDFTQSIETARSRYVELNREFRFTPPESGSVPGDRFSKYIQVRMNLSEALAPLSNSRGFVQGLSAFASLPEEVSRTHVEALRQNAMSLDEYRWITRQMYTPEADEEKRNDADPAVRHLRRTLEAGLRQRGLFTDQTESSSQDLFNSGLLDFTWLRVPEATRAAVREHAATIAKTAAATMADTLLLNFEF